MPVFECISAAEFDSREILELPSSAATVGRYLALHDKFDAFENIAISLATWLFYCSVVVLTCTPLGLSYSGLIASITDLITVGLVKMCLLCISRRCKRRKTPCRTISVYVVQEPSKRQIASITTATGNPALRNRIHAAVAKLVRDQTKFIAVAMAKSLEVWESAAGNSPRGVDTHKVLNPAKITLVRANAEHKVAQSKSLLFSILFTICVTEMAQQSNSTSQSCNVPTIQCTDAHNCRTDNGQCELHDAHNNYTVDSCPIHQSVSSTALDCVPPHCKSVRSQLAVPQTHLYLERNEALYTVT
ncbi:unnamed protein product [Hydatigera taeniaeformis]|uniref:Pecanex-like protein n=1 Tax=Hydatigena taeniaeformis TaxID=6205 RepID=A0A0R3X9Z5_HYDTA|nr:unnamed protein product [Hydatigera taeniaeformis]